MIIIITKDIEKVVFTDNEFVCKLCMKLLSKVGFSLLYDQGLLSEGMPSMHWTLYMYIISY